MCLVLHFGRKCSGHLELRPKTFLCWYCFTRCWGQENGGSSSGFCSPDFPPLLVMRRMDSPLCDCSSTSWSNLKEFWWERIWKYWVYGKRGNVRSFSSLQHVWSWTPVITQEAEGTCWVRGTGPVACVTWRCSAVGERALQRALQIPPPEGCVVISVRDDQRWGPRCEIHKEEILKGLALSRDKCLHGTEQLRFLTG